MLGKYELNNINSFFEVELVNIRETVLSRRKKGLNNIRISSEK
jgi:hypothetical protein